MPYSLPGASGNAPGGKAPPPYVLKLPTPKQHQWVDVWNSAYAKCQQSGKPDKVCEQSAFMQANGVVSAGDWELLDSAVALAGTEDQAPAGGWGDGSGAVGADVEAGAWYDGPTASVTAHLRLADAGAPLPAWQQIHKIGEWAVQHASGHKIKLTRQMGNQIIDNFNRKVVRRMVPLDGRGPLVQDPRIPLDERHLTDRGGPALGWFQELRWGNEGQGLPGAPEPDGKGPILYGRTDYTNLGTEKLSDRQLLYISPQYAIDYQDKETGKSYGPALLAVSALNDPFLRLRSIHGDPALPIAASEAVILSDGLIPYRQQEGAAMPNEQNPTQGQQTPPAAQPPAAPSNQAVLSDPTYIALSEQLARERQAREAMEQRIALAEAKAQAADQRAEAEQKARVDTEIATLCDGAVRRGVSPDYVGLIRKGLDKTKPDQPPVLALGDGVTEPDTNLHHFLRTLIEKAPAAVPFGTVTLSADVRPGVGSVTLDDQIAAGKSYYNQLHGIAEPSGTNGTQPAR